jgi:uncharacterized membrane protein
MAKTIISKLEKNFPSILITSGVLGLVASFVLTVDKLHVLKDPNYSPSCNINPLFSCGTIMKTAQAEVFGIPNTLFGIIAFTVILTVGVSMLFGAKFKPVFWKLFQLGALAGLGGVVYLFYQGIYRINAICPWCALTWAVVIALNLYLLVYNLRVGNLKTPKRFKKLFEFLQVNHSGVLVLIYLAIIGLLLNRFWYFFGR